MSKKDIAEYLVEKGVSTSLEQAGVILDTLKGYYVESLREKGEATIFGVGKLEVVQRPSKLCWNPSTKEKMRLPPRSDLKVSLNKSFKSQVI